MDRRSREARRRYDWADRARGIGIILVVFGHVISGAMEADIWNAPIAVALYDAIYTFHMPLFFLLSGVFIPATIDRDDFLRNRARTILYPYVLWTLIQGSISVSMGTRINEPVTPQQVLVGIAINPIGQFWFLWTLYALCLIVYLGRRCGLGRGALFLLTVSAWLLAFSPTTFDAIGLMPRSVCRYGLYFGLGICLSERLLKYRPDRTWSLVAVSVVGIVGVWMTREWRSDARLAPIGAMMGIAAALAIGHLWRGGSWIARLGRWSMPIYLGHVIAAAATRIALIGVGIRHPGVEIPAATVVGVCAPAVLGWARDVGHLNWLFEWRRPSVVPADDTGARG